MRKDCVEAMTFKRCDEKCVATWQADIENRATRVAQLIFFPERYFAAASFNTIP